MAVARARRRGVAVIDCAVSAPLDRRCAPAESQVYFKTGPDRAWTPTPTRYSAKQQRALGGWAGRLGRLAAWGALRCGVRAEHGPGASRHVLRSCSCCLCMYLCSVCAVTVVLGAALNPYLAQWLPSRRVDDASGTVHGRSIGRLGSGSGPRPREPGRRGGAVPRHCSHTHTLASST